LEIWVYLIWRISLIFPNEIFVDVEELVIFIFKAKLIFHSNLLLNSLTGQYLISNYVTTLRKYEFILTPFTNFLFLQNKYNRVQQLKSFFVTLFLIWEISIPNSNQRKFASFQISIFLLYKLFMNSDLTIRLDLGISAQNPEFRIWKMPWIFTHDFEIPDRLGLKTHDTDKLELVLIS